MGNAHERTPLFITHFQHVFWKWPHVPPSYESLDFIYLRIHIDTHSCRNDLYAEYNWLLYGQTFRLTIQLVVT